MDQDNCAICKKAWEWQKQAPPKLAKPAGPAPASPPWRGFGSGRNWPSNHSSKPWWGSPAAAEKEKPGQAAQPLEENEEMEESPSKQQPQIDLEELRGLAMALSQSLGAEAPEVQSLEARIAEETARRKGKLPKHILLARVQKKIAGTNNKLQRMEALVVEAATAVQDAQDTLQALQAQGRELESLQAEYEAEQAMLLQSLQSNSSQAEAPVEGSLAQQVATLLETANRQVDAGDEKAKLLTQSLLQCSQHLAAYLQEQGAEDQAKRDVQEVLENRPEQPNRMPRTGSNSRSPRRNEEAILAAAAAAAKAKGPSP